MSSCTNGDDHEKEREIKYKERQIYGKNEQLNRRRRYAVRIVEERKKEQNKETKKGERERERK